MKPNHHPHWYLLPVLLAVILVASCQKGAQPGGDSTATHNLTLKFKALAGLQPLELGKAYTNDWGEQYTVTAFKFYITQVRLVNSASGLSSKVNDGEYFLVNFADSGSVTLNLKAVPNTYDGIAFLLGVDSIRNVSGAQTGALDPAKGMFWTWNTGYIMAKLEGNSPVSTQPNNKFEYHIGGFAGANSVLKQVSATFPAGETLKEDKSSQVVITANVNNWFAGPHQLRISTNPVSMTPGPLSKQFADNYATMFTVAGITNQL